MCYGDGRENKNESWGVKLGKRRTGISMELQKKKCSELKLAWNLVGSRLFSEWFISRRKRIRERYQLETLYKPCTTPHNLKDAQTLAISAAVSLIIRERKIHASMPNLSC